MFSGKTAFDIFSLCGVLGLVAAAMALLCWFLGVKTTKNIYRISYVCFGVMPFVMSVIVVFAKLAGALNTLLDAQQEKIILSLDALLIDLAEDIVFNVYIGGGLTIIVLLIAPLWILINLSVVTIGKTLQRMTVQADSIERKSPENDMKSGADALIEKYER